MVRGISVYTRKGKLLQPLFSTCRNHQRLVLDAFTCYADICSAWLCHWDDRPDITEVGRPELNWTGGGGSVHCDLSSALGDDLMTFSLNVATLLQCCHFCSSVQVQLERDMSFSRDLCDLKFIIQLPKYFAFAVVQLANDFPASSKSYYAVISFY